MLSTTFLLISTFKSIKATDNDTFLVSVQTCFVCVFFLFNVVIYCCLLLSWSPKGIHPTTISESFEKAAAKAVEILTAMATPVALSDRESLLKSAMTSLSSKVRV